MPQENGSNGSDRLDRIERIIEVVVNTQADMQQDIKNLYRSQVVMGETMNKLGETMNKLEETMKTLSEAQQRTDESMSALIHTVDEIIRGRKPE